MDLVNTNFRRVNAAADLLVPTGSDDIRIVQQNPPHIPGIQQEPPTPRNVAQYVTTGAAAAGLPQGEISQAVLHPVQDNFESELDAILEDEMAQSRARRDQELRQAELANQQAEESSLEQRKATKLRKRATLKATMEAEERAHQIRLDQLRSETVHASVTQHSNSGFLVPPTPSPVPAHQSGFLPGGAAATANDPFRTRAHSVSFADNLSDISPTAPQLDHTLQLLGNYSPADIEALIDQRLRALGHGGSHAGFFNLSLYSDRGKTLTHKVVNAHMASQFGVFAQPVFEVPGDVTEVDMSRIQKVMTSGHDKVRAGLCYRQMRWPHRLLQTNVPGFDVIEHKDLTFHQFINGCIPKFMSEFPIERLDLEFANKFSFLQFLVNMSFYYKHSDVLEAYRQVHQAWQMKDFEFTDDWQLIKQHLDNIKSHMTIAPQQHTFK